MLRADCLGINSAMHWHSYCCSTKTVRENNPVCMMLSTTACRSAWSFLPTQGHVQFDSNGSLIQDRVRLHQYRMNYSGVLSYFFWSCNYALCQTSWSIPICNAAHADMQTSKGGDHIHVCQWHSFQEFLLNVLSMQYSSTADDSKLEQVQFGYTEIATHFNLTYLTVENDHSVFPGMYIVCVTCHYCHY